MPKSDMTEITKKLVIARCRLGLSQMEVAQRLNRTQSYVSRCETGKRRLDILELETFANLYGLPLSHFINEQGV